MAAFAKCNQCGKTQELEVLPLGIAMMPKEWLGAVRNDKTIDVCSEACAVAIDAKDGVDVTVIRDTDADGNLQDRSLTHTGDATETVN